MSFLTSPRIFVNRKSVSFWFGDDTTSNLGKIMASYCQVEWQRLLLVFVGLAVVSLAHAWTSDLGILCDVVIPFFALVAFVVAIVLLI
jgi:hypothetical protein